jgi:hypothetical protein
MLSLYDFFFSTTSPLPLIVAQSKQGEYLRTVYSEVGHVYAAFISFDYTFIRATRDSHSKLAHSAGRKIDHAAE